ncbi:hypothetical protein [Xanthomonas arboricola]|nr:hypothetical protein [Xanthomonas arboricola]
MTLEDGIHSLMLFTNKKRRSSYEEAPFLLGLCNFAQSRQNR